MGGGTVYNMYDTHKLWDKNQWPYGHIQSKKCHRRWRLHRAITADTVYTVYTVYTVDMVYTVYTVDMV